MMKEKSVFPQLFNFVVHNNTWDFRGHCAVYTSLHDPTSFKGIYLDYDPCSRIFVMYLRNGNFILLRLDLERT